MSSVVQSKAQCLPFVTAAWINYSLCACFERYNLHICVHLFTTDLKAALDNHMPSIVEKINLQALIPYLISHGLLTEHERQLLRNSYLTECQRKQELISIIQSKGPEGCRMFLEAVSQEPEHLGHREIVTILSAPDNASVAPITGRRVDIVHSCKQCYNHNYENGSKSLYGSLA